MAVAAQNFPHLHIGLFQEDEISSDDEEIVNQSNSARVYEEFNLGLIFQGPWCIDHTHSPAIQENEELSYSKNGEANCDSDDDNSIIEAAVAAEVKTTESREPTDRDLDIMTQGHVVEECADSVVDEERADSVVVDAETKLHKEDNTSVGNDIIPVVKDDIEQETMAEDNINSDITTTIVTDTMLDITPEHEVKVDNTITVKDTMSVTVAEHELNHTRHEEYYYGRQRQRVSKREKQERKLEKRKVQKHVEPSEIGFYFYCTQILIQPDCVAADDDKENEHVDEAADDDKENERVDEAAGTISETTTQVSENKDVSSVVEVGENSEASTSNVDKKSEVSNSNMSSDENNACEDDNAVSGSNGESDMAELCDDESFFAELGIDIHDSGTFQWDDCLDWDGIIGTPAKSKSKSASSTSKPKNIKETQKEKNNNILKEINTSSFEFSVPNYRMSTYEQTRLFYLECNSTSTVYLRKDKHRKREKLHKTVKSRHCTVLQIRSNQGRKAFHMHHRILKMSNLIIDYRAFGRTHITPMPKEGVDLTVAKAIRIKSPSTPGRDRRAPAQNLRHVLHETNVPQVIENELASFLMSIQNRDLTPEDYEMLLRLDDTVKAKTISKNVLANLKTEPVGEDIADILNCVICMEPYLIGQTRKFLACDHDFHSGCIDSWLANNSQNCPLDGLPIADS